MTQLYLLLTIPLSRLAAAKFVRSSVAEINTIVDNWMSPAQEIVGKKFWNLIDNDGNMRFWFTRTPWPFKFYVRISFDNEDEMCMAKLIMPELRSFEEYMRNPDWHNPEWGTFHIAENGDRGWPRMDES